MPDDVKEQPQDQDGTQHSAAPRHEATHHESSPSNALRIGNLDLLGQRAKSSLKVPQRASRPQLQGRPTTAVSLAGLQGQAEEESDHFPTSPSHDSVSRKPSYSHLGVRAVSGTGSDASSLRSFAPSVLGPTESILGDITSRPSTPAWRSLCAQIEATDPFDRIFDEEDTFSWKFSSEFEEVADVDRQGNNEEYLLNEWKAKLKHYFIFSSSGKPIWSRHGDDNLISSYIGIMQTLVSFYQGAKDQLRCFSAEGTHYVVMSKGHLHLVAISKLGESELQLQNQLESLYMQILSTLSLPSMERMFLNRPSTDLRRPLQGTEVLLNALADGFTRGSPSTLLTSVECLKLRKSHRHVINNTLLKVRTPSLLYGMIVADTRLVSVVRPKKHSLHPGDLQLIFNMLFEAGSIKAGGGENWIPLCLPGFNNTGFLYMYVSFIHASTGNESAPAGSAAASAGSSPNPRSPAGPASRHDEVAIILISANKEAFFELRGMRDNLLAELQANNSLASIRASMQHGRPGVSAIIPNAITGGASVIRHFLYKSRGNVQYVMPAYEPHFHSLVSRRRLMTLYGGLSQSLHDKTGKSKVVHLAGKDASALAWETPLFELYVVAKPGTSKDVLAKGANRVIGWIRREEERVFIIGGAVF